MGPPIHVNVPIIVNIFKLIIFECMRLSMPSFAHQLNEISLAPAIYSFKFEET